METRAVARYIRVSPRKARLVTDMIKGKDLAEAQQMLDFSPKGAAAVVSKVLASAAANAENNNNLNPDQLYVLRAYVDEGPTLKRFRPRAMGRATRINKRTSHITIVLEEREPSKGKAKRRFVRRSSQAQTGRKARKEAEAKAAAEEEEERARAEAEEAEREELEELEEGEAAEAEAEEVEGEEEAEAEEAEDEEAEASEEAEAEAPAAGGEAETEEAAGETAPEPEKSED